jgi:hypothetical protein
MKMAAAGIDSEGKHLRADLGLSMRCLHHPHARVAHHRKEGHFEAFGRLKGVGQMQTPTRLTQFQECSMLIKSTSIAKVSLIGGLSDRQMSL